MFVLLQFAVLKEFKYRLFIFLVGVLSLLIIINGTTPEISNCERVEIETELEEEDPELLNIGRSTISNIGINSGGGDDVIFDINSQTLNLSLVENSHFISKCEANNAFHKVDIPFYILYKAFKIDFI
tara:strand:- start:3397 stop:3777 length:381 start_codon:yes stop_codon:yes gene_type:complete